MRKQYVQCETREQAEQECPWAAEVIEAEGGGSAGPHAHGYWCFESVQDAETWKGQA